MINYLFIKYLTQVTLKLQRKIKTLSHVLESGDNPISSISSKKGLINFKAFQGDSIQKPILEAPIIIGAKDNTNSSLADMFKTKTN